MTQPTDNPTAYPCEIVGVFSTQASFESAVNALMDAGFERSALSVLSSHESIDAAGKPAKPWKDVMQALVGEIKYEGPLVASGAILLAGGTVAATIASVIAATTAGAAAKELLDEVTATPHTDDFARSLEAGSVILWVRADSDGQATNAHDILTQHHGTNVHAHHNK